MTFELCPFPPEDAMCGCLSRVCAPVAWFDAGNAQRSAEKMSPWQYIVHLQFHFHNDIVACIHGNMSQKEMTCKQTEVQTSDTVGHEMFWQ